MNYSEISKKPVITEVSLVPDAPCEECQINYPETEIENETEVTPELETPKTVFGVVSDCAALNIREEPSIDAKIVAVVAKGSILEIDAGNCDDEWFGVCTASGIQGFCMADYVDIKD